MKIEFEIIDGILVSKDRTQEQDEALVAIGINPSEQTPLAASIQSDSSIQIVAAK
jgi:hypothetical protein